MIFICWGVIFCMFILGSHMSIEEVKKLTLTSKDILYASPVEVSEDISGTFLPTRTYKSVGKRQVGIGLVGIMMLLAMYLTKPTYGMLLNTILFVFNGLAITALIGYTIEGLNFWSDSEVSLSEDEEGE